MKLTHHSLLLTLALAMPAAAEVIYSDLQDLAIPKNNDGVYLNVLTGSTSTTGWHINPTFGGINVYNSANFQPLRESASGLGTLSNITVGGLISNSSTHFASGFGASGDHLGTGGTFTAGTEGYIGFSVVDGLDTNYGWMRVVFTGTGTPLIKDWAYDTSGGSIAAGNVIQSGSTYTLDSSTQSFALDSAITGANSLVKNGANTVTLNANNTYSGTTTITEGTLELASGASLSATSSVNVDSGATLSGVGTIGGSTTIEGIHSPGTMIGVQTFQSGLSYLTSSALQFELNANDVGLRGTDFDGIDMTGGVLSIATGVTSNLVFDGAGSTVEWADAFWDLSRSWLVYDNANAPSLASGTIFDTINVSLDSTGATLTGSRGAFSWDQQGNNVHLVYTAIPEPRAALLGGFGLLMLLRRRR